MACSAALQGLVSQQGTLSLMGNREYPNYNPRIRRHEMILLCSSEEKVKVCLEELVPVFETHFLDRHFFVVAVALEAVPV